MRVATDRGDNHYNVRLTAEQVHQARILVVKGPVCTVPQLAKRWGIQEGTLRSAVLYKNWKWLPPPTQEEIASTSLPDWLAADSDGARPHCNGCVHWVKSCTMEIPEAGGFFAVSCGAYATTSLMD